MAQPPAFQFYAKDFYTGTADLSPAEVGTYARALAWSWDNGALPLDDVRRARALLTTPKEFRKVWPNIAHFWTRTESGYINERLESERRSKERFMQIQAENGAKGGRPRKPKPFSEETQAFASGLDSDNPKQTPALCTLHSASSTARAEVQTKNEVQRAEPARHPRPVDFEDVTEHLKAAAYAHLAEHPDCEDGELVDAVKEAAGKLRVWDYSGRKVTGIVNSVRGYLASQERAQA